jgi:hypothetical protein
VCLVGQQQGHRQLPSPVRHIHLEQVAARKLHRALHCTAQRQSAHQRGVLWCTRPTQPARMPQRCTQGDSTPPKNATEVKKKQHRTHARQHK